MCVCSYGSMFINKELGREREREHAREPEGKRPIESMRERERERARE